MKLSGNFANICNKVINAHRDATFILNIHSKYNK